MSSDGENREEAVVWMGGVESGDLLMDNALLYTPTLAGGGGKRWGREGGGGQSMPANKQSREHSTRSRTI